MIFKRLSTESLNFDETTKNKLKKALKKECLQTKGKFFRLSKGPGKDVEDRIKAEYQTYLQQIQQIVGEPPAQKKRKYVKRDKYKVVRDLCTAMVVCHNVTPVIENDQRVYQASSPDEVALVKISEELSMQLVERD
jgi:phospholipid-translocating ATPase